MSRRRRLTASSGLTACRPGEYRVVAMRSGYVTGEFGRRWPNGVGLPLTLAAGQAVGTIQIAMTPTAAISGRIRDRFDQPIGNVEVQALKATYQDGRRALTKVASVQSDDRGEYRLFWLPPGRYYLSARHPDIGGGMMRLGGFRISRTGGGKDRPARSSSKSSRAAAISRLRLRSIRCVRAPRRNATCRCIFPAASTSSRPCPSIWPRAPR